MTRSAEPDRQGAARPLTLRTGGMAGRRCPLIAALLVFVLAVGLAPSKPLLAGQVTQAYAEGERVSCGPRVVYVLARRLGCDVAYETIRGGMHLTEEGATIQEVKTALKDCGVACSIRRLDPTQLLCCRPPLIVHVNLLRQDSSEGHFLIVNDIGTDGIQTFDPYAGRVSDWKWQRFSDTWTGYAVVPEPWSAARATGLALAAALAVHILAFVGLFSSIRVARRWLPAGAGQGRDVARAVLIIVMSGLLASSAVGADEGLRAHANDGINAAALLGGICGVKIAPGPAAGGVACRTLDEVQ